MMGHSHAVSGVAIYAAVTLPLPLGLGLTTGNEPGALLLGALLAGGAALLPDWDHPQATISYSLPPLSNLAAAGISTISGGHRRGTHSLLGLLIAAALAFALTHLVVPINDQPSHLGAGILTGFLTGFLTTLAAKALHLFPRNGYLVNWAVGIGAGALVATTGPLSPLQLTLAVTIGYSAHLLGDAITTGRIKPLLPFNDTEFGFPLLGDTGSWREHLLTTALSLYVAAGIYTTATPWLRATT